MVFAISGKVALVTGGAEGIGYSCSKSFLENGAKGVAIADINKELGEKAQLNLSKIFGSNKVIFIPTDVTSKQNFADTIEKTYKHFGSLDILVNNAGIADETNFESTIATNFMSVVWSTTDAVETYLPKYRSTSEAVVLNVASIGGVIPRFVYPVYSATKHGVVVLSRCFGHESIYEKFGVRVVTLCPGLTETAIKNKSPSKFECFEDTSVVRKAQNVENVGKAALEAVCNGTNGSVWSVARGVIAEFWFNGFEEWKKTAENESNLGDTFDVNGKVALITGGADGIGYNYALSLLKRGLKGVAIADINEELGRKAVNELNSLFGSNSAIFIKTNVTIEDELNNAFQATCNHFKNLDIFINNAAISNAINWESMIATNFTAVVRGTILAVEKYLPRYKSTEEAVVLNVSSITAIHPFSCSPVYSATKAAVLGLTRSYGHEGILKKFGVKVVGICPGFTKTKLVEERNVLRYKFLFDEECEGLDMQSADEVGECGVEIIAKGRNGSCWLVDRGVMYGLKFPNWEDMRIK